MIASILLGILCINPIRCQDEEIQLPEAKVVEGEYSIITKFSYSAFLGVYFKFSWLCGASILNQKIILTAAHCLDNCFHERSSILVKYGNANRDKGMQILAKRFLMHEKYLEPRLEYDIGLVMLKQPLQFSRNVGRVALMQNPPYTVTGKVAGWGMTDEMVNVDSILLKHISQKVTRRIPCQKLIGSLPIGVFCGGTMKAKSFISGGDSGSALVVHGYIQIGIVSFKRRHISLSVAVYTDVGYFFNWIKENAPKLFCLQ